MTPPEPNAHQSRAARPAAAVGARGGGATSGAGWGIGAGGAASSRTILVADDDGLVRRLLSEALARTGYRVLAAADGQEALRLACEGAPDAVLLDVDMPAMHGLDVCRALKTSAVTRGIPVLLVTAHAQVAERARGGEAGADGYVTKPFSPRALLARLEALLGSRS